MRIEFTRNTWWLAAAALLLIAASVGFRGVSVSAQRSKRTATAFLGPVGVTSGQSVRVCFFNPSPDRFRVSFTVIDNSMPALTLLSEQVIAEPRSSTCPASVTVECEAAAVVSVTAPGGGARIPGSASLQISNLADGKTQSILSASSFDPDNDPIN